MNVSTTTPAQRASAPASISVVAWVPNREIDFPEWAEAGRRLGAMGRCGQWGIGDWILYGNAKFGERYTRAAQITGYDVQTLMNMVYVASKFEISRRREALSWSHHESVAALDPEEQERWLDLAAAERLSVADLRVELRSSRRAAKAAGVEEGDCDRPARVERGEQDGGDHERPGGEAREDERARSPRARGSTRIAVVVCPSCGHTFALPGHSQSAADNC